MMPQRKILCFLLIISANIIVFSQPAAEKQVNPFHQKYADSLKNTEYKSFFPIWGKEAYKKGFDIPLPYGIGVNYFSMKQGITIANTQIGFNGGVPINLSDFIKYGDVINTTNVVTVRPDLWVLPFLNVYGIAGYGKSEVIVPISSIGGVPMDMSTTQDFGASALGFGVTAAGGIGSIFLAIDNNISWVKTTLVDKAIPAYNLDARIGHAFITPRHADRSITVWGGAFMQVITSETIGHIAMSNVIPAENVEQIKQRIEESRLPQNTKDKIIDALNHIENSTVDYQLDKKVSVPWNLIFGVQYQHNKTWQGRVELGTFGDRTQFMLSINYRFQ